MSLLPYNLRYADLVSLDSWPSDFQPHDLVSTSLTYYARTNLLKYVGLARLYNFFSMIISSSGPSS